MSPRPPLLIISYHFAPSPLVGAKRFSFLTREFTRQGFDVHVIAHELRDSAHGREDASLPRHGTVHRVANPFELPRSDAGIGPRLLNFVFRRLLAPLGLEYFWAGAATRKALEVVRSLPGGTRGVIIATNPPHAALLAGGRVAQRLGWPLILDYRDPWSAYDWPPWHRGGLSQWLAARIERRLVKRAAAQVLNTPSMREWFEERFAQPAAPAARRHVIPNGFDPVPPQAAPAREGPLRLVHAGDIYGSRTLLPLLRALARLGSRHPGREMRVTNYGPLPPAEWQRIRTASLQRYIEERPRLPFAQLFAELQQAHVLLAVVSEHMTYSTPYKVYDYMAAGRPILGLAPADAALHDLLAESGAGLCADPQDEASLDAALHRLLLTELNPDAARVAEFRWSRLAQQYRSVIEQVFAAPPAPSTADPQPADATSPP